MQFPILKSAVAGLAILISGALVSADEADQLREKANAVRKEAAELSEEGRKDEARILERVYRELLEKAEQQSAEGRRSEETRERAEARKNPDLQHLKERLADLLAAQQKAKESGADQEFREIKEQIAQTRQKLAQVASHKKEAGSKNTAGGGGHHSDVPEHFRVQVEKLEVAARRMHHVRVAAENLKAAEMPDLAHELMERAAAMEQEIHRAKQALAEQMQAEKKDKEHQGKDEEGHAEVRELRSENERLRQELNELRELIEQLRNKPEL